jgi:hypothetical protein
MTIDLGAIWNFFVSACSFWLVFISLLAVGLEMGKNGKVEVKENNGSSALLLLMVLAIPACIVAGRVFQIW